MKSRSYHLDHLNGFDYKSLREKPSKVPTGSVPAPENTTANSASPHIKRLFMIIAP